MSEAPNTLISTSYLGILDLVCEGPISGFMYRSQTFSGDPLLSTYYDDVPVRNIDGSYNYNVSGDGFKFNYTLGTSTQTGIDGFQKVETFIPLGTNTLISNPPPGAGPYKTVTTSFNTSMFPDADSIRVTMRVPSLYSQNSVGDVNGFEITYAIDVSINDGPFTSLERGSINGKCTAPYYRTKVYVLPKTTPPSNYYSWKLKIYRTSQDIQSLTCANAIFVDSISVISSSLYAYPNSVTVGTFIGANQFASIPNRSYEIFGMLVNVPKGYTPTQYDTSGNFQTAAIYPNVWTGDFQQNVWTDNPAWIFYDIMTNPVHGLGDYIPSGSVDKWTLYQIAQNCDKLVSDGEGGVEPQFTCNVSIKDPDDAYTVLLNLASTFRGMLYYSNSSIHATQSLDMGYPVYSFNNSNVIDGTFSYSDTAKNTRSTVAMVKWIDPSNNYRENVEYIEDTEGILRYGYIQKDITAFACNSRGQAFRLGSWMLQTEKSLTETVTFQTSLEGLYLLPGDNFAIYDNYRNNRSQAGRISSIDEGRSSVTLDRPISLDAGVTYTLTAVTPKLILNGSGDLTGSNQIDQIRNSQIETFRVITPATGYTQTLSVSGQYSNSLYIGSPWILSASGDTGIFNKASYYTCLATSEIEPGKIEILGLQASTGISFNISTGYNVIGQPVNSGYPMPIYKPAPQYLAPETGAYANNIFYQNITFTWSPSTDSNIAYYEISGFAFDGSTFTYTTTNNSISYPVTGTGAYTLYIFSISEGGVRSDPFSTGYVIPSTNPYGGIAPLSGAYIYGNPDPLYLPNPTGNTTGYIGNRLAIAWNIQNDITKNYQVISSQFITGYRISITNFDNTQNYLSPTPYLYISGKNTNNYVFPDRFLYTGLGGIARRGFRFEIDSMDRYGGFYTGAVIKVNNEPPSVLSSGFIGFNGGFGYAIQAKPNNDVSGAYFWYNTGSNFIPTYQNYNTISNSLAGSVYNTIYQNYYAWYAITDTFGYTGCPIYGPILINPNSSISGYQYYADQQVSGAFALLTGMITTASTIFSGQDTLTIQTINGLSGQITGLPGDINTALNVRVNTATVSASGALSTQIDAVRANLQTTGQTLTAQVSTVSTALTASGVALGSRIDTTQANLTLSGVTLGARVDTVSAAIATTGGALSQWITQLSAHTTGQNASINIAADAFVTGDINGLGGAAIASWGFQLDANGKVVSMQATSSSFPGSYGTIVFGGATLQSSTYSPLSNGWAINPDGSVDFNNITGRGTLQSSNYSAGSAGWKINAGGDAEFNSGFFRGKLDIGSGISNIHIDISGLVGGYGQLQTANILNSTIGNGGAFGTSYRGDRYGTWSSYAQVNETGSLLNLLTVSPGVNSLFLLRGNGFSLSQGSSLTTLDPVGGLSTNQLFSTSGPIVSSSYIKTSSYISGQQIKGYTPDVNTPGLDAGGGAGGWAQVGGAIGTAGGIRYGGLGGGFNLIAFYWDGSNVKAIVDGVVVGTIPT